MKHLKHFAALFVFAAAIIMLHTVPSQAYTETTIATDNTWISGSIDAEGEADFYKLTTTKAGWLTVTYQGWNIADSYYQIKDVDMTKDYYSCNVYTSSDTNPKTNTATLCLEAGTYYVKVYGCGSHTGDYRLKASFKACNNNETESNNLFTSAMALKYNQKVTGALTVQDQVDFYKVTLSAATTVRIYYTAYISDSYMSVWDSDQVQTFSKNVYTASEDSPITYMYETKLNKGVNYIKINPCGTRTGRYTIKIVKKYMAKSIAISNNHMYTPGHSFTLKATFTPSNTTDKTVKWTTANSYIASVDQSTGKVTTNHVGKVKITASAQDGSNVSKTITVIVKPAKEVVRSLYTSGSKRLYFSCNYQDGASGYQVQYSTSSKFTSAKTKAFKNSSGYLTSLKKGTKYYVRIRAYYKVSSSNIKYGAWSNAKAAKVTY